MTDLPPPPVVPAGVAMPPPPAAMPSPEAMPPPPVLVVHAVSKFFGELVAVSDVTFTLGAGVTALLGPNGAGKSTLLRMLSGQARPSNGQIRVLGRDPKVDADVRRQIGLAPQQEAVFGVLTAHEFVSLSARLQGVDQPDERAAHVLGLVELDPTDDRLLPTYSKGMRQRVKLAQAMVHDPALILLDEPLTGLDPRQRVHMIKLIHELGDQGKCILVSSHVLEEVQRFGSNIIVIAQGRLAASGDFRALRDRMDDRPRRIHVRGDDVRSLAAGLVEQGHVVGIRLESEELLIIDTDDARRVAENIAVIARDRNVSLREVRPLDEDLESVFRYLVGG